MTVALPLKFVLTSSLQLVAFVKNQASKRSEELIKFGFDLISGKSLSGTIRGDSMF